MAIFTSHFSHRRVQRKAGTMSAYPPYSPPLIGGQPVELRLRDRMQQHLARLGLPYHAFPPRYVRNAMTRRERRNAHTACILTRHTNASAVEPQLFVLQGNAYYPMATSPTMQSSTMPTYTMPTGTVPTTTITMSGHAPAYSAPTYAYASPVTHVTRVVERPQIVEREIVLPPEAPPVQHVRHVVYQEGAWTSAWKHNVPSP
jgi:hypothetical protein